MPVRTSGIPLVVVVVGFSVSNLVSKFMRMYGSISCVCYIDLSGFGTLQYAHGLREMSQRGTGWVLVCSKEECGAKYSNFHLRGVDEVFAFLMNHFISLHTWGTDSESSADFSSKVTAYFSSTQHIRFRWLVVFLLSIQYLQLN